MTECGLSHRRLRVSILVLLLIATCAAGGSSIGPEAARVGHVLNRIAYGPSPTDRGRIDQIGLQAYIEEQLNPAAIDESANDRLRAREEALFEERIPVRDTPLVTAGALYRYRKGTAEPQAGWRQTGFDDSAWLQGLTGIGYGDGDDRTIIVDMRRIADQNQPGYMSLYLRRTFPLTQESLAAIDNLILRVDYDDGFIASLNGTEVARANMPAGDVSHDQVASSSHEAGSPQDFDISAFKDLLYPGDNTLAIQVHNHRPGSSDLTMIPEVLNREVLRGPPQRLIRGVSELQQLMHVRGLYSQRQLQTVLAEFWENHFTTDYDKLMEFLDELQNSDASDAMTKAQARAEAAQAEYDEYEFFYDNALGHFGDLLLYSATSPCMLVYLDNVENVQGRANENYAREILELHTFGVDNRYTQTDIEQLANCFTGWSVCKVDGAEAQAYPGSALNPLERCGVQFEDTAVLELGTGWKYFKGSQEPSPDADGNPTTAWTEPAFDDSGWLRGETGIGFGDGDDATVLDDMRGNYRSVYLRRRFVLTDPAQLDNLILEVAYDDGFVAYVNGMEVARSETMENRGNPPAFDRNARQNHEVTKGPDYFNLSRYAGLLKSGTNLLAIQVHNASLGSGDLSMLPRVIDRTILPGSVENGDRNAVWRFHFRADEHDTSEKVLFEDTPYEMIVPAGREGQDGLQDAVEAIEAMVRHPSTAEFICIKLIQKFVSDEITPASYEDFTAPTELLVLLREAVAAWNATDPPGHIGTVMRTILDPVHQSSAFWSEAAYRSKVKTPIEYINSSLRALDAEAAGPRLPVLNGQMGMELFTRDDPDGYSELGSDWIDTASMLSRIEFVRELAENRRNAYLWDAAAFLNDVYPRTPDRIVEALDEILFQGTLSEETRNLCVEYLSTGESGEPKPLNPRHAEAFERRVRELVGLMLSLPQWHYQ